MSLTIDFIVRYSDDVGKIGTLTTRTLTMVEKIEAPDIVFDEARAVSVDKKTTQRTVIAEYSMVNVSYVFPTSELALDDEFRKSALGANDTFDMDCTGYPWINKTLTCSMDSGNIITSTVGIRGTHLRRSFVATVTGAV